MSIPKTIWRFSSIGLCLIGMVAAALPAQEVDKAAPIKAAMLLNLAQLAEWPDEAFKKNSPGMFFICIICSGEVGAGAPYRKLLDGEKVGDRRISVVEIVWGEAELPHCPIVFVPEVCKQDFAKIVEAAKQKPILTIGNFEDATKKNGMVGLFSRDNKMTMEFNEPAIRDSRIKLNKLKP